MTVQELIEELQKCNQNQKVYILDSELLNWYEVIGIKEDNDGIEIDY